jgi:hypothetical protein
MGLGIARRIVCERCGTEQVICTRCYHGQRYCSPTCSRSSRDESARRARKQYRQSEEGRLDHRDAERIRRAKLKRSRVADQGIENLPSPAKSTPLQPKELNDGNDGRRGLETNFLPMEEAYTLPVVQQPTVVHAYGYGNSLAAIGLASQVLLRCFFCGWAVVCTVPRCCGPPMRHKVTFQRVELESLDAAFAAMPSCQRLFAVPDGRYVVRVVEVELKTTRFGSPMLQWTLEILGPSHAGSRLFRTHVLDNENGMKWLKADLQICNVKVMRLSDLPTKLTGLNGIDLDITKRRRGDYTNIYFNRCIGS